MYKQIFFFFSAFLLVHSAQSQDKDAWKWFTPKGETFAVHVPYEMQSGEKKVLTDVGTMHPVTWLCKGKEGDYNHLFLLSYVDYPQDVIQRDSIDFLRELLNESMQAHIEDLKAELVYDGTSDYLSHPGIIYRATYNEGKVSVKCRMMIIGNRFYSLQAYCPAIWAMNQEMDKFLMSFSIKPL